MAVHLLVRDELGDAVADGVGAVVGELQFAAAGEIHDPQVARAHEAHVTALRRDLGIGGEARARRELARGGAAARIQIVEIQLAAERKQQASTVRRPLVFDDAGERRDALAFAPRLLLVRERFLARHHHGGIDQQARLAGLDVVLPQVEAEAVVVLAAQEGHA